MIMKDSLSYLQHPPGTIYLQNHPYTFNTLFPHPYAHPTCLPIRGLHLPFPAEKLDKVFSANQFVVFWILRCKQHPSIIPTKVGRLR